jgi:predicted transcriptional regulator
MEQSSTMTIRLPAAMKDKLERLAEATERSKAFLAAKAIEEFVAAQEWQIRTIQEALREADTPKARFMEHEAVVKKIRSRMARRQGQQT